MRALFLLLFMFSLILKLNAQNYEITFTASGESTTLDEVEVVNLTTADSILVSGTDVLNLVGQVTGIPSSLSADNGLRFYPNPMKAESRIQFYTSAAGPVNLEVFDLTGKLVVSSKQELRSGDQTFALSGLHSGLYTLRASTPGQVFSTRVISVEKNAGMPALRHEKSEAVTRTAGMLKSGSNSAAVVELAYTDGDWILLKGKGGNHQRIVTLVASESQVVDFEFVECADADNNNYPVVTVGTQTWMAENLKTTKYNNGTAIPNVADATQWGALSTGAYAWHGNDAANGDTYGALYNYFAVESASLCPIGWHVPTDAEWTTLTEHLGGLAEAGGKIKATTHWFDPNTGATNESGFTALPSGYRSNAGGFLSLTRAIYMWSATEIMYWNAAHDRIGMVTGGITKPYGFSVRCVQN